MDRLQMRTAGRFSVLGLAAAVGLSAFLLVATGCDNSSEQSKTPPHDKRHPCGARGFNLEFDTID